MRLFISFFALFTATVQCKRLPDVYWNVSNPGMELFAEIKDHVEIRCPYSREGHPVHQSVIYRVSEHDYHHCHRGKSAQLVGICASPTEPTSIAIVFRMFSPTPNMLEYQPDKTYYFISTSDGSAEGLQNESGGLCESHDMKMMVHLSKSGHPRRPHHHHGTMTTSTTPSPARAPQDPQDFFHIDPLKWEELSDKERSSNPSSDWRAPSRVVLRGERVSLDVPSDIQSLAAYERDLLGNPFGPDHDRVEFEIHEIGDAETLAFSSTSRTNSLLWTSFLLAIIYFFVGFQ